MLFNLIALVLILMITAYLATQGMMSALLALVTGTFSSILAMGLMEALQGLISGWRADYARGVTFLLLFFLAFSATRIGADMCVPKNIKLPLLINRLVSGFIGFFTGMVVVGTTIIGIEMLPLHTVMMGYDRFPGPNAMQGSYGSVAQQTNVWLAPERFTLAIWNGVSGRGLGGIGAFSDVHPDINVESYGYRNTVQYQSKHAMLGDFLSVPAAWWSSDNAALSKAGLQLTDTSSRLVMVRSVVKKGDKPEHGSYDSDTSYFRVTPSQVRMVSDAGRQYYPVGYLENGRSLKLLTLGFPTKENKDQNCLVEDYPTSDNGVVHDWVFQIRNDEKPKWFEMKQLARVDLTPVLKESPTGALAANQYPLRSYLKELSNLEVTVLANGKPVEGAAVYLIEATSPKNQVGSEVDTQYAQAVDSNKAMLAGEGGWSAPKALELRAFIGNAVNRAQQNYKPQSGTEPVQWDVMLRIMIAGQLQPDPLQNYNNLPEYINNTMVPKVVKNAVLLDDKTGADGKVKLTKIPPRSFEILVTYKTDTGYYIWMEQQSFTTSSNPRMTFATSNGGGNAPAISIERR